MSPTQTATTWMYSRSPSTGEAGHWSEYDELIDMESGAEHPRTYLQSERHARKRHSFHRYVGLGTSANRVLPLKTSDPDMLLLNLWQDDLEIPMGLHGNTLTISPYQGTPKIDILAREGMSITMPKYPNSGHIQERLERILPAIRSRGPQIPSEEVFRSTHGLTWEAPKILLPGFAFYLTPTIAPRNIGLSKEWFRPFGLHGSSTEQAEEQGSHFDLRESLQQANTTFPDVTHSHELIGVEESPVTHGGRERLFEKLYLAFEAEPFENGVAHRAEQIIAEALQNENVLEWLGDFCTDIRHPDFAASVLRCLGRQSSLGTVRWRSNLISGALASHDMEIRDAAVQTVEAWGGEDLVAILKSHNEPEHWIREYILEVIDDFGM